MHRQMGQAPSSKQPLCSAASGLLKLEWSCTVQCPHLLLAMSCLKVFFLLARALVVVFEVGHEVGLEWFSNSAVPTPLAGCVLPQGCAWF